MFEFNNCQDIQVQNFYLNNIKFNLGSIFSFTKSNNLLLNGLVAKQIIKYLNPPHNRNLQLQLNQTSQLNNFGSNTTALFIFLGCQNIIFQNSNLENLQDVHLIYANHYYNDKIQMYFLNNIEIILFNVLSFQSSDNSIDQIIQITTIQASLQNIYFKTIQHINSLIYLNPLEKVQIEVSNFENINLNEGSVIDLQQGQLLIDYTNFTNINSAGYPCALNILQGETIQITNSKFINLANSIKQQDLENQLLQFQGGAIKFQNTQTAQIKFSIFKNCLAMGSGGAIYSYQSKQKAIFEIYMTQFIENQSILDSGGALYFLQQSGINITQSNFTSNLALKQNGGAIYFQFSSLIDFQETNFSLNQADIGGSIYYSATSSDFLKKQILSKNKIYFEKNQATFYGQNIGSIPFWIGISEKPSLQQLKIVNQYQIRNISSGNYLDQPLYLNFIDEEGNPFNFFGPSSLNGVRNDFSLQLYSQNNSQIIIQQGINAQLNETIGLFQLNFQSIYKISQKQKIYILSNEIQQNKQLQVALELQYRDCIKGETISEKDQFIQCNQCVQGRYSLKIPDMQKDINSLQCFSCPSEASFCQGSQILLKDGYWRENDSTDQIYSCNLNSCSFENIKSKNGCLEGYVGPLCNSCDSKISVWNYQYGLNGQNCYICSQWVQQYLYFSVYFAVYFVYIAYSHHSMIQNKIIMYKLIIFKKIDLFITSKSSSQGQDFSLWFKIFINYLQILSCIMSFNITIPHFFNVSLNLFGDPIQLTATSFDCLVKMSEQYPVWLNRIVTQIISMVAIYFLINLSLILITVQQSKDKKKAIAKIPNILTMTFIFVYIFYQPSLSKMLIQGIFCIKVGSKYYLISDYNQQCYTYHHNLYTFAITIPLIIFWCFLIPIYIFFKLKSFQQIDQHQNIKGEKIDNLLIYGILYDGYKTKFLYWEIFKIFHKFILMSITNLNINQYIQVSIILLTTIFYFYILTKNQPHKNVKQFETEKKLIYKLLYTYALLLVVISDNSQYQIYKLIGLIIIAYINLSSIKLAFFILVGQIQIQIDETDSFQNDFKKCLLKIKNKYPNIFKFLYFRKIKIIRIHQLWKKVILSFRQNLLTSKNFQSIKAQTLVQHTEAAQNQQPASQNIIRNALSSSNMLYNSNDFRENINQKQLIPQSLKLIQMYNISGLPSQDSPNSKKHYFEANKFTPKSQIQSEIQEDQ
ncbi:transmembrane protein, putative (macronuclear) [Tetrahymena thermophila SB210]|uniref:Transmembrane protein, putative n=1 Tax=Tetrahymena thermophila (strain SB210) TaxID=312017 RepID=Q241U7_TETTS|nr:transmembrane protein, putative [Tetrahymena thermophila SB210]EAS02473.2 transmembrane protein, putative [Tetrahymena thermophila SB210]|eukprot:XP_001022718.2 transmembrane protein, putative [Tetrahymena thermophila SB210]